MAVLQLAGFFRELEHGSPDGPSLRRMQGQLSDDIDEIIQYLRSAVTLAATGTIVYDILSEERIPIGVINIQTDGAWAWPSDLPYYVETYRVAIPRALLQRITSLHRPPDLSSADLTILIDEVFDAMDAGAPESRA